AGLDNCCSRVFMREAAALRRDRRFEGSARPYPERADPDAFWLDHRLSEAYGYFSSRLFSTDGRLARQVERLEARSKEIAGLSDGCLRERAAALRAPLLREGFAPAIVVQFFALVGEAASREIGHRHYPVQLMGGQVLLDGGLAEMEAGE